MYEATKKKAKNTVEAPSKTKDTAKKMAASKKGKKEIAPPTLKRGKEGKENASPVEELKALFIQNDLPPQLVPNNVVEYHYNPSSGDLKVKLASGFEKAFDKENVLKFDSVIEGRLKPGKFTRIKGIHRGSASIISVERAKPGFVAITGKLGWFKKTLEFSDSALPDLP